MFDMEIIKQLLHAGVGELAPIVTLVLIKKQVKKELAKAKPEPADDIHEHLDELQKAITAGHNEVVKALHEIGQAAVRPVVVEHVFKPPEVPAAKP